MIALQNKHNSEIDSESKMSDASTIAWINKNCLPANYAADKILQRMVELVKSRNKAKISRLPAPWREKFHSFRVDDKNLLYMNNRLVIPAEMRRPILNSLHYGHPGRDEMLRFVSEIWWPKIHREVINIAKVCKACGETGKKGLAKASEY